MRLNESCAECMFNKEMAKTDDQEYLAEIRGLLEHRRPEATSCDMVYEFDRAYERYFGQVPDFREEKRQFNDLVLAMEEGLRKKIEASEDPLAAAIVMSRIGNYIDFAALEAVEEETFLALFEDVSMREEERRTYESFCSQCGRAGKFLLFTDNCGEIVLDKLMLETLQKRFPQLEITVMVRGGDVMNDATMEDAEYVGLTKEFRVITSGALMPGIVYREVSKEARAAIDAADVILAKGQGNYEGFAGEGHHAFFTFLCKCDLFVNRFGVTRLTGMFVEE